LIEWLCSNLGLPLIEERHEGGLRFNAAAHDMFGAALHSNLAQVLTPLLREGTAGAALESSLQRARAGEPCELALSEGLRALAAQASPGFAYVVLAPLGSLEGISLQRRAMATDRAARISHELANALGAIAGWARLAKDGAPIPEALDLIEKSAEDAWYAARNVLGEVSGQQPLLSGASVIDFSTFTAETARLLVPKARKKSITIRTHITPGLNVAGERSSAWAIVWNLATNAVEALQQGGNVHLQLTEAAPLPGDPGLRVQLCISDDGPGMSAEVRARIFEPYFTTKRTGSGLGLPMVKQAVAELGGYLSLESEPNQGTRFIVDLPRTTAPARQMRPLGRRPSGVFLADHLDGRFLIIDDDASLREMIGTALQMRGAQVELASSMQEALLMQGPFRLAVVDYLLGDQRGDVVLQKLRAAGLVNLGLLVTGTDLPRKVIAGGEPDGILRKPFELNELFEQVAELTAPGRRRATGTSA
jgi:signal transduction histidine kinase/CheY-like chemotaxis protein